jgi:hypothetical protein
MSSSFDIVASEVMGDDVAIGNVISEGYVDGDGLRGGAPMLLAKHADLTGVVCSPRDHLGDRLAEDFPPVEVEELARLRDHAADVAACLDPALDDDVDAGSSGPKTIAAGRRSGPSLAP